MRLRALLWFLAVFASCGPAFGGSVGVVEVEATTSMYSFVVVQQAGQSWDISTSNLSAGSDTVIHVQDESDPQGGFIAGNDDWGGLQSFVNVPAPAATRLLRVIVRAYSSYSPGTCTVSLASSDGQSMSWSDAEFGGSGLWLFGPVGQGTRIQTAELPGGSSDTVLLVIDSTQPARAVAYDDDDGVSYMSWLRLGTQCATSGCFVVLAKFNQFTSSGPVRIVWDEDVEKIDFDADQDGLSGDLESAIGTSANNTDSDSDGINDNVELLGVDTPSGAVKFAAMGADPTQKDLFIEADWVNCVDAMMQQCPDADRYKLTLDEAAKYVPAFLPVRIHLDIGVYNPDPNTRTSYGDFGGANVVYQQTYCNGFSPAREGYFHHLLLAAGGSTGFGACGSAAAYYRAGVHEIGHMFGLLHGGRPFVTGLNWKPQYRSIMNYAFSYDPAVAPAFSHGDSPIAVLDPRAMVERDPSIGGNSDWRERLTSVWGFKVDAANGWVDWNRDGEFAPAGTTVRAAPTQISVSDENNASVFGGTLFDRTTPKGVMFQNLTLSTLATPTSDGQRLYLFGTNASNQLYYNFIAETTLAQRCSAPGSTAALGYYEDVYGNCTNFGNPTSTGITSIFAPALAQRPPVAGRLMVITVQSDGKLHAWTMIVAPLTGSTSWVDGGTLPGNVVVEGPPAAVLMDAVGSTPAQIRVFAPSGGRLKGWTFDTSSGAWTGPSDERWSASGTDFITPTASIGVTRGVMLVAGATSTPRAFAAIPHAARFDFATGQTLPENHIRFAAFDRAADRWIDLGGVLPVSTAPAKTTLRPGIAYMPFGATENPGRFYVAWSDDQASMTMTEGNNRDTWATSRRFKWLPRWTIAGNYYSGVDGISLFFDPAADSNLRVAFTTPSSGPYLGKGIFGPMADGVIQAQFGDLDDYQYITGALRSSLGLEPFPLP